MKKIYLLFVLSFFGIATTNATIHTVTVANFAFSPTNFDAQVGDTVRWVLQSGTHTTTSTAVPLGANTWNQTLSSTGTSQFDYKILLPGSYAFHCEIHPSMVGNFSVATIAGTTDPQSSAYGIYPIPFQDKITVAHGSADAIQISNNAGEKISLTKVNVANDETVIDLPGLPAGIYFINIIQNDRIVGRKKIVKVGQ